MDFSKLSASEKTATYASAAVIVLAIYAIARNWGGLPVISLLGAAGVLAVIFMPQMSPGTSMPGSRGSLMLILGGAAAVFWALSALTWLDWIFRHLGSIDTWIFLVGLAAALWLGWLSWQTFQAEGGKFVLGSGGGSTAATPPPAAPSAPPPAAAPTPPAAPPASEPMSEGSSMGGSGMGGSDMGGGDMGGDMGGSDEETTG